ncbi:hypothetical protein NM208_g5741 [Fusarium decemcellulare]|uniref:Uncharacterized protein n=1 Tax=Fusarium decemcellulare TaxID=57161 RepID=A0ACC1SG18_9HYPO|nr:hypothetical protein NM208_g5741 [Fusarium decemcellulare]
MPSVSPDSLQTLTRLAKEYRIEFINDLPVDEWPRSLRKIHGHVTDIGSKQFDSYATGSHAPCDEPWKLEVKSVAKNLVERACRCTQRNETSWRAACEHVVFSQLSAEVACRRCRKRIWRSEIESERLDESNTATALKNRQQAREPCRCPRKERSQDYLEASGINRIFGHREDEAVRLDAKVSKRLSKELQKPDKVFGLRQTRNIENLLYDTSNAELSDGGSDSEPPQVHELVPQPLNQNGDVLLFPFLLLEAKSGVTGTDWHSIQLQTAFPIRRFLETQHQLLSATRSMSDREFEPVVWFLSNKGEDWRLSVAFTQQVPPGEGRIETFDCKVAQVWGGSITSPNGALQLLLLVDYIFDWARDLYREDIIRHLRLLASGENDAATVLYADTDLFSTHQQMETDSIDEETGDDLIKPYLERFPIHRASHKLQCRSANYIESRFCCVIITRDNFKTFQNSLPPSGFKHHEEMEQWTGHSRRSGLCLPSTNFLTAICFTTFINKDWHLVRELHIFAVENDELVKDRILSLWTRSKNTSFPVSQDSALSAIKYLQSGLPSHILLDAINRRCVMLEPRDVVKNPGNTFRKRKPFPIVLSPHSGPFRLGVHAIYKYFKKGILEPEEPFLRVSKRFDVQNRLGINQPSLRSHDEGELRVPSTGCVWVYGFGPKITQNEPKMCLYFVQQDPITQTEEELAELAKLTFEAQDVYHTIRSDWVAQKSRDFCQEFPWNLEDTFGMCVSGFKWFPSLERRPSYHGSYDRTATSGRYIYKRNPYPWKDPRDTVIPAVEHDFIRYKVIRQAIRLWRINAKLQASYGRQCCEICAFVDKAGVCDVCRKVLNDPARPLWFRQAIKDGVDFPDNNPFDDASNNISILETKTRHDESLDVLRSFPKLKVTTGDLRDLKRQLVDFRAWRRTGELRQRSKRRRIS